MRHTVTGFLICHGSFTIPRMEPSTTILLRGVQSQLDLEGLLPSIAPDNVNDEERDLILVELKSILSRADIVPTSKLRRRVSRLIESIDSSRPLSGVDFAANISTASSTAELESALNSVVVPSGDDKDIVAILFNSLSAKLEHCDFDISRQLRRRMTRMMFALKKSGQVPTAAPTTEGAPPAESSLIDVDTCQKWIDDIEIADCAQSLEDALGKLTADQISDSGARSRVVAILMKAEANKHICSNSKIRRRISRFLASCRAEVSDDAVTESKPRDCGAKLPLSVESSGPDADLAPKIASRVPYVVFVGQLSFDVTSPDLEDHFRTGGVEGMIKVRLNVDSKTGRSKGTAFVELEGPRELHKSLGLHHTLLNSRRINVEKSCGGRNKQHRSQKIKQQRDMQKVKASEDVDAIIKHFEQPTDIKFRDIDDSTMNRIYACTPSEVREIFDNVSEKISSGEQKSNRYELLKEALTIKDQGGHDVDQSRNLGYGSFKRVNNDASLVEGREFKKPRYSADDGDREGMLLLYLNLVFFSLRINATILHRDWR